MAKTKDMTKGSVLGGIIGFAMPVFFGMLFQQVYNMVDTAIVGKYLGRYALAGVGSIGSLYFLVIGTVNGICSGFAIPVAQEFGAKNYKQLRRFVAGGTMLSAVLAVIITLLTTLLCKNMLIAMDTPTENGVFEYAYQYIFIIYAGIPLTFLYNMTSGILRSLGDSRTPLIFLIVSSIVNIVLDFAFILGLGMGVRGAALATIIAQGVSGIGCLIYMMKKCDIIRLSKRDFAINGFIAFKLLAVGLPMGLQFGITAIGTVIIQAAINGLGDTAVAGVTAGGKIGNIVTCPLEALGATMATFAGQNVGAGELKRVKEGLIKATLLCFGISIAMFGVVYLVGKPFELLFLDTGDAGYKEIQELGYQFILWSAGCYCLLTIVLTFRYTIQGMGYSTFAMIAGILEMIARTVVGLTLPAKLGFISICWANPAAWIAADIFLIPAFFYCLKKSERLYAKVITGPTDNFLQ